MKAKSFKEEGKRCLTIKNLELCQIGAAVRMSLKGDKKEVKKLYSIMHGLEKRKTPTVENGFGTAWLGCLVNALGADWNKVYCRKVKAVFLTIVEKLMMRNVSYLLDLS